MITEIFSKHYVNHVSDYTKTTAKSEFTFNLNFVSLQELLKSVQKI